MGFPVHGRPMGFWRRKDGYRPYHCCRSAEAKHGHTTQPRRSLHVPHPQTLQNTLVHGCGPTDPDPGSTIGSLCGKTSGGTLSVARTKHGAPPQWHLGASCRHTTCCKAGFGPQGWLEVAHGPTTISQAHPLWRNELLTLGL